MPENSGDNGGDNAAQNNDAAAQNDDSAAQNDDSAAQDAQEQVRDPKAVLTQNVKLTDELKNTRTRLAEMEAAEEERRKAALTEHEAAIEAAIEATRTEERAGFNERLLVERIRTRATGVVIDPDDAVALVDASDLDADDTKAIDEAIAGLLKAKPHLAATKRRPGIDQGPQGYVPVEETGNDWMRRQIGRG